MSDLAIVYFADRRGEVFVRSASRDRMNGFLCVLGASNKRKRGGGEFGSPRSSVVNILFLGPADEDYEGEGNSS